eukprot:TRINITY_DN7618_c0_g1_i1.p1 TRINITY_DN7618_c0_g1~~TRINITY_DN7618_c0_g1_i1.p1  ORF type:complete len:245 (+),score=48.39 TRINITY_DN7618_c0_g1_i1:241-975(+)
MRKKPLLTRSNQGVSERSARDELQVGSQDKREEQVVQALTAKAAQYAQLHTVAGAELDSVRGECLVDVEYKQLYETNTAQQQANEKQVLDQMQTNPEQRDQDQLFGMISAGRDEAELDGHAAKLARLHARTNKARLKQQKIRDKRNQSAGDKTTSSAKQPAQATFVHTSSEVDQLRTQQREAEEKKREMMATEQEWGRARNQPSNFVLDTVQHESGRSPYRSPVRPRSPYPVKPHPPSYPPPPT